jgi:hypothetical protein
VDKDTATTRDSRSDKLYAAGEVLLDIFKGHVKYVHHFVLELLYKYRLFKEYTWKEGVEASSNLQDMCDPLYT